MIPRERPGDSDAIRAVHRAASAGSEADHGLLVDLLREDGDAVPALSLVAELDGASASSPLPTNEQPGRRCGSAAMGR